MIARLAIKKLISISALFAIFFVSLQFSYIQEKIINLFLPNTYRIYISKTDGFFPFFFKVDNISITSNDVDVEATDVFVKLSANIGRVSRVEVGEVKIATKTSSNISCSNIVAMIPIVAQNIIKRAKVGLIDIDGVLLKNSSFYHENGQKHVNFDINSGHFASKSTITDKKLSTDITFNDMRFMGEYTFENASVSLDFFYKNKKQAIFHGALLGEIVSGALDLPQIDLKSTADFQINQKFMHSNIKTTLFKASLRYNFSDYNLLIDNIIVNKDILVKPFNISSDGVVSDVEAILSKGNISIKGMNISQHNFNFGHIVFNNINISQFNENAVGIINGVSMQENGEQVFKLKAINLEYNNVPLPNIELDGKYLENKLAVAIVAPGYSNKFEIDVLARDWDIRKDSKIKGAANGVIDISKISLSKNNKARGEFKYSINIDGTISEPILSGDCELNKASYVNISNGTYLKNGTIRANISKNSVYFTEISATDDSKARGVIKGYGKLLFKNFDDFIADIKLEIAGIEAVELREFDGLLFGNISIKGNILNDLKIKGDLYSKDASIDVSNIITKSSYAMDIVESANKKKVVKFKNVAVFPGAFDIKFRFDPHLKIIGNGLSSKWSGGAMISGNIEKPEYEAKIDLIDGSLDISQRKFKLKDGKIYAKSSIPDVVFIDISAIKSVDDKKVGARFIQDVRGSNVQFLSTPHMGKRDVLSYLLFGKKSGEISTGEAFTLLSIMNQISGGGVDLNIVDKIKGVLGIDTIDIKNNRDNIGSEYKAVSIGKNLGNKVKVSLDQGAGKDTTKVVVEADIHKNTKLSVDLTQSIGAGIAWSKRY